MKDEKILNRQLTRPPIPDDLETKIHANWQDQRLKKRGSNTTTYFLTAASLFGIFVVILLSLLPSTPNDLLSIAINDIDKDEKQHVGITLPVEIVLSQANINLPPDPMPIQMAKICNLDGNKTTHIKVLGERKGVVHLFIKAGEFNATLWESKTSTPTMPWRLIKPRNNLSVLVVYTSDMNPASIDKLIQTMFYT